jgi:hypothetical protein
MSTVLNARCGVPGKWPVHFAIITAALLVSTTVAGAAFAQNLPPTYGTRTLSTDGGGQVDIDIHAGGYINAQHVLGPACVGMVAEAPDFRLQVQGSGVVQMDATVESTADTTLIISTPDGQWLCNDDTYGFNPAISIMAARAGSYDMWVGTFEMGGFPAARLSVATTSIGGAMSATPDTKDPADVAMSAAAEWWYAEAGATVGPVSITDVESAIADGAVTRETLVWRDGMAEWTAAASVDSVSALFPPEPPPLPEPEPEPVLPPPLPDTEVSDEEDAAPSPPPLPVGPSAQSSDDDVMTDDVVTEDGMAEDGATEDGITEDGMTEEGTPDAAADTVETPSAEDSPEEDGIDGEQASDTDAAPPPAKTDPGN